MQTSQSTGDQFSKAIKAADPRTKAKIAPVKPDIQHGHETDAPVLELPQKWLDQAEQTGLPDELFPGMPRNADGSERPS